MIDRIRDRIREIKALPRDVAVLAILDAMGDCNSLSEAAALSRALESLSILDALDDDNSSPGIKALFRELKALSMRYASGSDNSSSSAGFTARGSNVRSNNGGKKYNLPKAD